MNRSVLVCNLVFLLFLGEAAPGQILPPSTASQSVFLPIISRPLVEQLLQPADFTYLGAFRLPPGGERPATFDYGGNAMTFNPAGDPAGPADGLPGSLFISGHDRLPYGELPNGGQIAEISIPLPVKAATLNQLNRAAFLQNFSNVAAGFFPDLDEMPRMGLQYLNHSSTGPKIHLAWGQHFQETPNASHAWFNPILTTPNMRGTWYIGNQSLYSVNGYMLEIPAAWANTHAQGRYLGTGRYRDGGWSGMGPALFAYRPWTETGNPPADGTRLSETTLLLYENSQTTEAIERCLNGYQHADSWEGAAWITTNTGKSGVLFAGTKATGAKYWYGFVNPAGPGIPCVEGEMVGQFPICRLASGAWCPAGDLTECSGHTSERGWWSARFDSQFILYNPADLVSTAKGESPCWSPQPYAAMTIDQHLFLNPAQIELDMLGTGIQRKYRIGDVTFDRTDGLLYVLELFADEAAPVVHVWRIQ